MRAPIRTTLRHLTVFAIVVALGVLGLSIHTAIPAAHADTTAPTVTITGEEFDPGDDLTVHVTITNPNDTPIYNPFLRISLGESLFQTQSQYLEWQKLSATANAYTYLGPTAYAATTDKVPSDKTVTRSITIKHRFIQLAGVSTQHGILPLGVKLSIGGTFIAAATNGVAWNMTMATPSALSLLIPITAPTTDAAYYTQDQLEEMMQPGGTLTRQLDAIGNASVAVAVDPKIVASVQRLGTNAPEHIANWLGRLEHLSSVTPLMWGDADPIAVASRQKIVSVKSTLATESNWQHSDWLIPAAGRLKPSVLHYAINAGYHVIVASDSDFSGDLGMPATGKLSIALSLSAPGTLLATYMSSGSPDDLAAFLNVTTVAASSTKYRGTPIVLMPRNWSNNPERLKEVIAGMGSSPWLQPQASLTLPTGQTTKASLAQSGKSLLPRGDVHKLLDRFAEVQRFSAVAEHPSTIANESARHVASLLSAAWHDQSDSWASAQADYMASSQQLLHSIKIVSESKLTLVARTSHVPVAVQNTGTTPVKLRVRIQPTNGRIVAEQVADITIPAGNSVTAKVPVRALANGHVDLRIQLLTPENKPIGLKTTRHMLIRAQWETFSFLVMGSAVVALFVVGLIRGFRRNHRKRLTPTSDSNIDSGNGAGASADTVANESGKPSVDMDTASTDSPGTDSPSAGSADADSPDTDSPDAESPDAGDHLGSHSPHRADKQ